MRRVAVSVAVAGLVMLASVLPSAAHTDSDYVALPAGSQATVTLKPTHGCGDSPTVVVAIRAPVEGASAGEVAGWTATSTSDGAGNTVLEWTGGSLPSDQTGAFPVTFTVPDTVGELLTFPSIQQCENGDELAWISGDPNDESPAPRLLVLSADSEPAATLDDVPANAPGRDQLQAIVDVDNPGEDTTTSSVADTTSSTPSTATSSPDATEPDPADDESEDDDSNAVPLVIGALVVAGLAVAGGLLVKRRG